MAGGGRKVDDLLNIIAELETDRTQQGLLLAERSEEIKRLRKQLETERYDRVHIERTKAREEFEKLKEELAFELGAENRKKQQHLDRQQAELDARLKDANAGPADGIELRKNLKKTERKLRETDAALKALQTDKVVSDEQRIKLSTELDALKVTHTTAVAEFETQRASFLEEREKLQKEVADLTARLRTTEDALASVTLEKEALDEHNKALDAEIVQVRGTVNGLTKDMLDAQTGAVAARAQTDILAREWSTEKQIMQEELDELHENNEKLTETVEREVPLKNEAVKKLDSLTIEHDNLMRTHTESVRRLAEALTSVDDLQRMREQLESQAQYHTQEMERLKAELAQTKNINEEREKQLLQIGSNYEQVMQERDRANQQLSQSQSQIQMGVTSTPANGFGYNAAPADFNDVSYIGGASTATAPNTVVRSSSSNGPRTPTSTYSPERRPIRGLLKGSGGAGVKPGAGRGGPGSAGKTSPTATVTVRAPSQRLPIQPSRGVVPRLNLQRK